MQTQTLSLACCSGILVAGFALAACDDAPKEQPSKPQVTAEKLTEKPASSARASLARKSPKDLKGLLSRLNRSKSGEQGKLPAKPVAQVVPSPDDPVKGKFDLADAGKGLTGSGYFIASVDTTAGKLECELWHDKAPISVANFVGLARGLRPWKTPEGKWVKKPLYDGTPFHRVIKGFMIQGGDPNGNGSGGPGYVIPDEVWEDGRHDKRGLLCMANRGPNTNGSQFFIMDGAAAHLDGGYTILGKCGPDELVEKIASTPVSGERATDPVKIKTVKVRREAKMPAPAPSASAGAPSAAPSGAAAPSAVVPRSAGPAAVPSAR